jgi:YcxB-like protein
MGETIEASTDVVLGEAIRPAAVAQSRIHRGELGATVLLGLGFVGGTLAGTMAGTAVASQLPQYGSWPTSILSLFGMFVGLVVGLRLYSHRHMTGFLAALRKLGAPAVFPTRFVFDEEGIRTENDRMSHRIAWPAILFIVPSPDHWLVQVDTMTIAIPRRAFAGPVAEQAFLDLAKERLSEEARTRSVLATQ